MKKCLLVTALLFGAVFSNFTQNTQEVPQIAIMDVMSTTFTSSDTRMFTVILRTDVFKLNHFRIVERGLSSSW